MAVVGRVVNLDAYTGKFDEGIRAEQLLLMSAGFRPVRDIFAAQGPLSLDIFYPAYALFGQTLAAARAAVVIYSLVGLAATCWVGGLVGGRAGALVTTALLVLSPLYLKNSRLALLEVPALVPATLALGALLRFQAEPRRRWLLLGAASFAVALLIKPMVLAVGLPLGVALVVRRGVRPLDLLLFAGVVALLGGLVVAVYGPEQVWQQVVAYRAGARQATGWSLRENWSILQQELRDEPLGLYALGIGGALYLALSRPRSGLPLALWPLANFGLLLVYSPLQFKHVAILLPPLALTAGLGLTLLLGGGAGPSGDGRPVAWLAGVRRPLALDAWLPARLLALGLLGWYLVGLPGALRLQWQVVGGQTESRVESYAEESALLAALSRPGEFVLADDPIVAFNSRRLVPPWLVDTSSYRIRSGGLGGPEVVAAAERYDVRLLFLFSDGLRELRRFDELVDARYRAIKIYERLNAKDRALYLRDDGDFGAAREVLARDLTQRTRVDFGGDLRLLGYNLGRDELRPGATTNLTLHWEAIRPMASDYHVITHLRGPNGQPDLQSERGLGGGGEGTRSWEAGRWVFRSQVLGLPARLAAGDYELSVALYDSRTRTTPPITAGGSGDPTELRLGQVRVR